jgi:transposase
MNQIRQLLITAPTDMRDMVPVGTQLQLARALQQITATADSSRITAILIPALAAAAARWIALRTEAQHLQHQLTELLHHAAPRLMALDGIGSDTAARILIAIGDNRTRIKSEAALAHLFGIAPIPASSGRSTRHRLDRGGNRQGNAAIHRIALVRLAHRQDTREYITRCTARGKTHREAIRLLKRHLVREIYLNL